MLDGSNSETGKISVDEDGKNGNPPKFGFEDSSSSTGRKAMLSSETRNESMPYMFLDDDDDTASVPVLTTSSCSLTEPTVSTMGAKEQQQQQKWETLPPPSMLLPTTSTPRKTRTFTNFSIGRGKPVFPPFKMRVRRRERKELHAAKERMAATKIVAQDDAIETGWNWSRSCDVEVGVAPAGASSCAAAMNYGTSSKKTSVIPETVMVDGVRATFSETCFDEEENCGVEDWDMDDAILFVNNEFTVLEFTSEDLKDIPAHPTN